MSKTRVFGGKDDKQFWSDKPVQEGHPKWPKDLEKPILEYGSMAEKMRLKVVHSSKND